MADLLNEPWTGANGAAWPATWQPQADQVGSATLVSNAGQLTAPANSTAAARQQTVNALAGGDYDIAVSITVPGGQASFSIGIVWRADGSSDPAAVPGSRMFPVNGQSLRLDTNGDLYLYRQRSGGLTVYNTSPVNVGNWVGVGPRNLRIQQVGTTVRVRVWNGGSAEPAIWALEFNDGGAWTTGGKLSLAISAGFGGAVSASQTVQFDNLVVATPTTPPPPPVGTRRNWATMSATDQQAVIDGFQRAKGSGAYDNLTRLHQQAMADGAGGWHGRPIFLPVHRWFLTQLEGAMSVAVPYWDWANQPFPAGLGGSGDPAQNYRVTSGPFANWVSVVYDSTTGTFSQRNGIIRQFGSAASDLPTPAQQTAVLNQLVYDASPWGSTTSTGLRNKLEGWSGNPTPAMHNRVHEWVGGDMRFGTSPNDPVFWLNHSNVDRLWAGWQKRRGVSNYAAPAGQGANDPMPLTGGVTPAQVFSIPSYDLIP